MNAGSQEHLGHDELILLVDDEPIVRRLVREMLKQSGYSVIEASNGQEALRLLRGSDCPVHLMLTDIIMPHMDGSELAKEMARFRPHTRVLFMSGYASDTNVRKITSIGGQCISKPFSLDGLRLAIRQMLDTPWTGLSQRAGAGRE